jgi:DNA-binding FadR family transcriptional regulator
MAIANCGLWCEYRPMTRHKKSPAATDDTLDSGLVSQADENEGQYYYEQFSQGRLHGSIARRLGIDILKGVYAQGEILPYETESSLAFEISRSAYREAIRILAAKGLVESRPRLGTKVTARKRWNILDPEVLGWMFETQPSKDFIRGLFELRLINEPMAAALAAARRKEYHLEIMDNALTLMARETLATEAGRKADLEFHEALLDATNNEALIALSSTIGAAVAWSTRFKQRQKSLSRDPVPEHRAVFDAIVRKDEGDARWAMETLIRLALKDTEATM